MISDIIAIVLLTVPGIFWTMACVKKIDNKRWEPILVLGAPLVIMFWIAAIINLLRL